MNCTMVAAASTSEAEYFAAALASREGIFVRDWLEDVGFGVTAPTPLYLDSQSALDLTRDPVAFKLTKHILRHAYELRDRVARDVYAPQFVETARQLADILTKALRSGRHRELLESILNAAPPAATPTVTRAMACAPRVHAPGNSLRSKCFVILSMLPNARAMPPSWPNSPNENWAQNELNAGDLPPHFNLDAQPWAEQRPSPGLVERAIAELVAEGLLEPVHSTDDSASHEAPDSPPQCLECDEPLPDDGEPHHHCQRLQPEAGEQCGARCTHRICHSCGQPWCAGCSRSSIAHPRCSCTGNDDLLGFPAADTSENLTDRWH